MRESMLRFALVALMAMSVWQFGNVGMIQAKAWLAPVLIENAWKQSLESRKPTRPWTWADTWPVAKLTVPSLSIEQYVLSGANGASLPFGPGHVLSSARPGEAGTIAIAAHRDTHFWFLDQLGPGDEIQLETWAGPRQRFVVADVAVIDTREQAFRQRSTNSELILVTCQPTNAFSYRGPHRLIVAARALPGPV